VLNLKVKIVFQWQYSVEWNRKINHSTQNYVRKRSKCTIEYRIESILTNVLHYLESDDFVYTTSLYVSPFIKTCTVQHSVSLWNSQKTPLLVKYAVHVYVLDCTVAVHTEIISFEMWELIRDTLICRMNEQI
jgi:hypothetical protein